MIPDRAVKYSFKCRKTEQINYLSDEGFYFERFISLCCQGSAKTCSDVFL